MCNTDAEGVSDVSKARADNDNEQDSCSQKPRDASCADNDIHLHIINRLSSLARRYGISYQQNLFVTNTLQLTNTIVYINILFPLFV